MYTHMHIHSPPRLALYHHIAPYMDSLGRLDEYLHSDNTIYEVSHDTLIIMVNGNHKDDDFCFIYIIIKIIISWSLTSSGSSSNQALFSVSSDTLCVHWALLWI